MASDSGISDFRDTMRTRYPKLLGLVQLLAEVFTVSTSSETMFVPSSTPPALTRRRRGTSFRCCRATPPPSLAQERGATRDVSSASSISMTK